MIVEHVSEQTSPLVTAISRLEREIELLREYRTRLVAADLGDETEAADEEASDA